MNRDIVYNIDLEDIKKRLAEDFYGYLQPAVSNISESVSAPVMVKHDYRDIKIDASTTVTIDLEDIKKRLAEDFYRSQGIGLMLGD